MSNIKNFALAALIASIASPSILGQQTRPLASDYRNQSTEGFLTKANKASGLIGMDVRNPQNEKLGDIKDIVLDLHSGKVAYTVLSVGGFLGIGDKYIAVPPSEFTVAPDGRNLILNADKAKIQSAPGFAKNDWPDINNPSWHTHSLYWTPDRTGLGTQGSVRSGRETGGTVNKEQTFDGRITSVDPATRMITVEGASGKHQFKMSNRAAITLKNDTTGMLENVKVGDHVTVRYHNQNGTYVAESLSDANRLENK